MVAQEPVSEIVFTVQFPQIAGMTAVDVCALYERLKDRFPTVQHAPRLPPIQLNPTPQTAFVLDAGLQIPRTWMISSDAHRLVQLQDDRLSFNWRRMGAVDYPSFEKLRHEFAEVFGTAEEWCAAKFSGQRLVPSLCELHYQNQIPMRTEKGDRRIFEIFAFQKEVKRRIGGYSASWFEPPPQGETGYTNIVVGMGVLPDGLPVAVMDISAVTPILADAAPPSWFNVAHARALDIFRNLVIQDW